MTDPRGSEDRIAAIRARVERATGGPWYRNVVPGPEPRTSMVVTGADGKSVADCIWAKGTYYPRSQNNAEFICHAREDIPWLLERLTRAEAVAGAAEGLLSQGIITDNISKTYTAEGPYLERLAAVLADYYKIGVRHA